jgi:hypothetical protein
MRFDMSSLKVLLPNPTDALKKSGEMWLSAPTARAISITSAPLCQQMRESELMDHTRCARNALVASFENSGEVMILRMMLCKVTQCE